MDDPTADETTPLTTAAPQPVSFAPVGVAATPIPEAEDPRVIEAAQALSQVMILSQAGRFADAADLCADIVQHLQAIDDQTPSDLARWLVGYATFARLNAQAIARLRLGAITEALMLFQQALSAGRDGLLPLLDEITVPGLSSSALMIEIAAVEANAINARMQSDLRIESFRSAQRRGEQLADAWRAIIAAARSSDMAAEVARPIILAGEAEIAIAGVFGALARAEGARRARDWDGAIDGYDTVEDMIAAASAQAARLGVPIANDAQTALLNASIIPTARRRLEENRALIAEAETVRQQAERDRADAAAWRASLTSVGSASVTAIATADAKATAIASAVVDNVVQVAIQQALPDVDALLAVIANAPLGAADTEQLATEADAVKAAAKEEKPDGFFKKVAEFTENAAKLLKGVEEAAGPLGKLVKWVAPYAPLAAAMFGIQ
jgi:hypothetical protein